MTSKALRRFALALALAILCAPLLAHHGAATYDPKLTTVKGTVTDFRFMNPHSELLFDVTAADAKIEKWTAECPSATTMARLGWNKSIFKPGDQVTFSGNVAKSGAKIMRLRKVVFPTGKEMMIDRGEDYAE
jgi:hypothetical protein